MKYEHKYPAAKTTDLFESGYSFVAKSARLGECRWCRAMTKWSDQFFKTHVCSEECGSQLWGKYNDDQRAAGTDRSAEHHETLKYELKIAEEAREVSKDIIIVVHNQLDLFKACIESVRENTDNYHLYIWDNGSSLEVAHYIDELYSKWTGANGITTYRTETNTGFIYPNNEFAGWGEGEYLILLNSDTKVFDGWDRAMTGFLDAHPDVAQVGYWGGHLGPDGKGFGGDYGYDVDYIPGWCVCLSRAAYNEYGLFSKELEFAYCEDSDLSLRLKEAGKKIYALHAPLVYHHQNQTIKEVEREGKIDVRASFDKNHAYIQRRWERYLKEERVVLKLRKDSHELPTRHLPVSQ